MTLSDLAAIGSFISGFAVLISLAFLYFQLRQIGVQVKQAEKNQQASIRQQRTARLVEMLATATDASFAEALVKGFAGADDMTDTQYAQFGFGMTASFRNHEDSFYQHADGLLSESAFESLRLEVRPQLSSVGSRVFWKMVRGSFAEEFVSFMNDVMETTPVYRGSDDAFTRWKSAVAAERTSAH